MFFFVSMFPSALLALYSLGLVLWEPLQNDSAGPFSRSTLRTIPSKSCPHTATLLSHIYHVFIITLELLPLAAWLLLFIPAFYVRLRFLFVPFPHSAFAHSACCVRSAGFSSSAGLHLPTGFTRRLSSYCALWGECANDAEGVVGLTVGRVVSVRSQCARSERDLSFLSNLLFSLFVFSLQWAANTPSSPSAEPQPCSIKHAKPMKRTTGSTDPFTLSQHSYPSSCVVPPF